ncbi:uncharacterized protein MELLADRAFT_113159 [Melampsora larici-populina 98AG31]|uniref:Uncharacterized protein n=1 Tax=Melampsora larici-populina (strain 98AG31 / pathotype 3-4-7) TaxID=747676 RepID=F4S8Y1_MELLP|nr:uncharacterized protein MELLADRAFT_113159 [Melampsora larici-populina 98AG31]EGF98911.1 hypothetical protein MELLADRAFT_113159 [Melampsora larici-populina 98AG31]
MSAEHVAIGLPIYTINETYLQQRGGKLRKAQHPNLHSYSQRRGITNRHLNLGMNGKQHGLAFRIWFSLVKALGAPADKSMNQSQLRTKLRDTRGIAHGDNIYELMLLKDQQDYIPWLPQIIESLFNFNQDW